MTKERAGNEEKNLRFDSRLPKIPRSAKHVWRSPRGAKERANIASIAGPRRGPEPAHSTTYSVYTHG